MTTPIIMLALLTTPYFAMLAIAKAKRREFDGRGSAAVGLGLLFLFTGVGHFIETEPMAQMLPPFVPQRVLLVYVTGLFEFALAMGFFIPKVRQTTGIAAMAALVFFFPVNVYAAIERIPLGGHAWGPVYLLVRAPLQAIILGWIYWFTVRRNTADCPAGIDVDSTHADGKGSRVIG